MAEVWFYHLERSGPEAVLPELLEKALARGWRALVKATSAERLAQLDEHLWTFRDEAFLPHGRADHPQAEDQPILLTLGDEAPNGAAFLALIDNAAPPALEGFARTVLLFDGADEASLAAARKAWAEMKAAGHAITYWQQRPEGGWEKKG